MQKKRTLISYLRAAKVIIFLSHNAIFLIIMHQKIRKNFSDSLTHNNQNK